MRPFMIVGWLLVPILAGAYHYGPGQQRLELDSASDVLSAARRQVERQDYAAAVELFDQSLAAIPRDNESLAQRVRLERAKAQLLSQNLPAAYDELVVLVPELQAPGVDQALLADAEATLASAKYYLTWLMRLEGQPRQEWEPEIESSRQIYRLLAEQAEGEGRKADALAYEEDLEAAMRLARLDLSELQALPLPCQCRSCCSGQCKGKRPGQCKRPGPGKQPKKDEDARGASSGPPPDGSGN